jgi:hypothetical protein
MTRRLTSGGWLAMLTLLMFVPEVRSGPAVARSEPAQGARDVDPATPRIVVTFDTPMQTDSFSVLTCDRGELPELIGIRPLAFRDDRTFVLLVKLKADTDYAMQLNSASQQGFRAADGTPLPPTVLRFRTGAVQTDEDGGWGQPDGGRNDDQRSEDSGGWGRADTEDRDAVPGSGRGANLPAGWTLVEDPLFGTRVAVPPGWSPRVRGDVAYCVEPNDRPLVGVFFVPMMIKGSTQPAELADAFDAMLRRSIPDLRTSATGAPAAACIQRELTAVITGTPVTGRYRAVVGRHGTCFVMGYLAPRDSAAQLERTFYRILASYRYTGPRLRLQPFKSAAVELRIPPGWQVRTSEGSGTANQDIDWQVASPQVPATRAFMVSPKYISPNWVSDMLTGQPDPQGLGIWQMKGYQLANITSDEQALQVAIEQVLPGFEVQRQQRHEAIEAALTQAFTHAIQTLRGTGGDMRWYVYELQGRRTVNGAVLNSVVFVSLNSMYTPGGVKGTLGMWNTQFRGFEAPANRFAQLAPTLDRVASSFTYTLWWIQEVQKANAEQARIIRKFWAESNRIDREMWDHHMQTQDAIYEMMYDNLTENHAYVNRATGAIEKVPAEHLERFRRADGEIVSPEDVLERHIPLSEARPLREANADDYMAFDRRVLVWP